MKTQNYEMFGFMKNNRKINDGLVKRLINSINQIGYVESRPIIVNESMIIIDGQNRFEACKRLNIPVTYVVENINMQEAMINLNMNQQIWRLNEYIDSWANSGIQCYKELVDFENKYHLGVSNNIVICGQSIHPNDIRMGKLFNINLKKDKIAEFVLNCRFDIKFYKEKHFIQAVYMLFKNADQKDIDKVFKKIPTITQQALISSYLAIFENIINRYKKNDENIVCLTKK